MRSARRGDANWARAASRGATATSKNAPASSVASISPHASIAATTSKKKEARAWAGHKGGGAKAAALPTHASPFSQKGHASVVAFQSRGMGWEK